MLQTAHAELGEYEKDLRRAFARKEEQIERLKRAVFEKEKDESKSEISQHDMDSELPADFINEMIQRENTKQGAQD
ncbi:MAG: hypothetical protein AAF637_19655 [Pseudomonadota bacterium]